MQISRHITKKITISNNSETKHAKMTNEVSTPNPTHVFMVNKYISDVVEVISAYI